MQNSQGMIAGCGNINCSDVRGHVVSMSQLYCIGVINLLIVLTTAAGPVLYL